tara:strand:- start:6812 stop:7972 length:1161 start_codon:yes stop_codon:yes gene_type:complete
MYSNFQENPLSSDYVSDDSSYEDSDSDSLSIQEENSHFLNRTTYEEYEKNRNKLYTKDILRKRIVIDSHNYFQPDSFNTSDFLVVFDFDTDEGSSLITTNYDIYHNVIGFRLVRTTIRTPPFNVNSTNNIIKYKRGSSNTIHTITINPGVYNMTQLSNVFQQYEGSKSVATVANPDETVDTTNYSQFCTYTDSAVTGVGTFNEGTGVFTPSDNTISLIFHASTSTTMGSTNGNKAMAYELTFNSSSEEITILWDYNNITRGAARLFGYLPKQLTTVNKKLYSNRTPDVSTHFVDLCIPQIPSIGCKKNSSGRDIIERIQLKAGHGEYLHYGIDVDESKTQQYFAPITLHRLNIQLWAVNNVLYDTNNSDSSFEFEITMIKNKKLLV